MSDITPGEVMSGIWRWIGVVIVAIILFGVLTLVMWQAGWWFSNANTSRQAQQTQNGYSNQTTLHQQVTSNIATIDSITTQITETNDVNQQAALKAQRAAIAGTACQEASEVSAADPLPVGQQQWVSANCANGVVSPSSSLYQAGAQ